MKDARLRPTSKTPRCNEPWLAIIQSATETIATMNHVAVVHGKDRFFVSADMDDPSVPRDHGLTFEHATYLIRHSYPEDRSALLFLTHLGRRSEYQDRKST